MLVVLEEAQEEERQRLELPVVRAVTAGYWWSGDMDYEQIQPLEAEIENLKLDLATTDWYVVRFAETGKPIPEEVLAERQGKRQRINELQEQIRRSLCQ